MYMNVFSQDVYQETNLEFGNAMNSQESYLCEATTSIRLLPGFAYKPVEDKSMSLKIDRYSVFPPIDGYYGGMQTDDGGVVGSMSSSFNVSNTGAAIYSINIEIPAAIGAMKPNLAVVYNNQSADGILGWSWDLSGLSFIARTGQTEYHDGKITDVDFLNDRFVMDGQRLMLVSECSYGADKAEYKTEIDNMDKIVSYTNNKKSPEYFIVWKNDGTIWEYGSTDDSRIEAQNDNEVTLKWLVSKVYDRDGNTIVFNYDEEKGLGTAYIKNIQYTFNEEVDLKPAYNVSFEYEFKHNDVLIGYVNGNKVSENRLLKSIYIHNNYTGKQLYNYSFEYHKPGMYDGEYYIYHRLKTIGFAAGNDKINPTRIIWKSKDKHSSTDNNRYKIYQLDKRMFSDNVPFVGDFNGDGYSDVLLVPYKVQNAYPQDVDGKIYLNNREGGFYDEPMTSIRLPKNIEWIYVVDMNGDGKDDVVLYELNYDALTYDDDIVSLHLYTMKNGDFYKNASYTYKNHVTLLSGRFVEYEDNGMIVIEMDDNKAGKGKVEYIRFVDDVLNKFVVNNGDALNCKQYEYLALDMSGDGVNEIFTIDENGYKMFRLKPKNGFTFEEYGTGNFITKDSHIFPNDFNGDGKTDLLYYDFRNHWNIAFSKGNSFTTPMSCTNTNLLRNVSLGSKDKYRYSLKDLSEPSVTIRTSDFDGDGTADVGVFKDQAGNHYLEVGFKPIVNSNNKCVFVNEERYYIPINYSHQTIQMGRFLPQENVSILSGLPRNPLNSQTANIATLHSHSEYYSVERIVDGLGNVRGFEYDYLMQKNNVQECFYSCSNDVTSNDIRRISVPILALKSDTTYSVNGKPIIKKYEYYNTLIHGKGHGFMGFERVTTRNFVCDNIIEKQVQCYETGSLHNHSIALPLWIEKYNGENQLLNVKMFAYRNFHCVYNDKIIMPLMVQDYELNYNPDKIDDVIKIIIQNNNYASDISQNGLYENVVRLLSTTKGFTNNMAVYDPQNCQYFEKETFTYNDDVHNWIINRPIMKYVFKHSDGNEKVGFVNAYVYDYESPFRVIEETKVPNCKYDITDSLTIAVEYKYDKIGNVILQRVSSPSLEHDKVVRCEYGELYNYMYKTKNVDELGRVIRSSYNPDYGFMVSTIDYNDYVTKNEKHPLGINDVVTLPDGMVKARVIRWAEGNEHSPVDATYYVWEKSTGMSEDMTFYHKSGMELRSVSFDIDGNAIYIDKEYDDLGNLIRESMPYYRNDEKLYVLNVYDKYNRLVERRLPNGITSRFKHDGNTLVTEFSTVDGKKQTKKETYNIMGWLVETIDNGSNNILYDYYSDGSVKSASIEKNPNSKITFTYDNLRNKKSMCDPNYGLVSYEYDALGNLKKVNTPSGDKFEFQYDAIGRMLCRSEMDVELNEMKSTRWIYDDARGRDGVLKKVVSDNHEIDYVYDNALRLVGKIETVKGKEYKTLYGYDPASRVSSIIYPSGFELAKVYSNSGYEKEIYDSRNNIMLWRTNETTANGLITRYSLGNGIETEMCYNPRTLMVETIKASDSDRILQNMNYVYDGWGNVKSRSKHERDKIVEEFEYDEHNRLISVCHNGKMQAFMDYDYLGNIEEKVEDGVPVLYSTVYDQRKPNVLMQAKTDVDKMAIGFSRDMKYSVFDNLISVSQGDDFMEIDYGCENNRVFMRSTVDGKNKSKTYIDGCEFVQEDEDENFYTYLNGPIGVFAVCITDGDGNNSIYYIHKDNIASWNVITNDKAEVVQDVSFDAWGNVRSGADWKPIDEVKSLMFDRGFTGHEHLLAFGLINMNGRIYDPMMSMMLSPDNNIQLPKMSQNFNRYSYCLNNPLKYTDPTGEWVESVVLGVVGGAANVVFNARNIDSFGEGALLFGVGFVKGFLTEYTAGQSWIVKVGVRTLMTGVSSGLNTMVSVGDGSFKFSGDDWNSIKTAAHYGLGSGLVKSFMYTNITEPTEDQYAESIFYSSYCGEISHSFTSLAAHGAGCWFSGQPFLQTLRFKDVGFDLNMLGVIAKRLIVSYVIDSEFADQAIRHRAQSIKESILENIWAEDPDYPYFYYNYEIVGASVDNMRLYIIGNVFEMLPGEMTEYYPKPFLEEVVSFPFSYSLFKTLFFNNKE